MNRSLRNSLTCAVTVACAALGAPVVASAQGGDGYLFSEPNLTLKFESGYGFQRAGSDIFDFVIEEHTLSRRDFDSPYIGGEIGIRLSERLDLALAIGYQSSSQGSEFRDWVDADDLPITQVTELRQIPAVASVKFYPLERGQTLGRFAWIPRTVAPFIGAGVGWVSYEFEQYGDFVDFETLDIFSSDFVSDGDSFLARVSAGVNISLGKQFLFTAEGRYGWAQAQMQGDFVGFDQIDLDGLQLIGGLAVRF
jgi:hypothetical protein